MKRIHDLGVHALVSMVLVALLSCERDTTDRATPPAPPAVRPEAEFRRHLRLGIDQLRRRLPESAAAELGKCALLRPDDPDLLFHQARLELLRGSDGQSTSRAVALLERVVAIDDEDVRARRILATLASVRRDPVAIQRHRRAVEKAYGQIGEMEMRSYYSYVASGTARSLKMPRLAPGTPREDRFDELLRALEHLRRDGTYAPGVAVPVIEKVMKNHPHLAAIRLFYAKKLFELRVRVNFSDRPGLPLMSSTLVMDYAQSHLERVLDQIDLRSAVAREATYWLSRVAINMADYDEGVTLTDILLDEPGVPEMFRRRMLGQKGLARYKQGRYREAIGLLGESIEGASGRYPGELSHRWLLHLAHEGAGTPPAAREVTFEFRKDLPRNDTRTPLSFDDIAPRLGINKLDGLGPSAWGDYDRDGDFDLYVSGCDSYGALYRNDGDHFTDISSEAGLFNVQSGFSATFVDFDNNGWPDLFIGRDGWNGPCNNSLYRNDSKGAFVDVTGKTGIHHPGSSFVHAWSDVDRDGDLDLFIAGGITVSGDTNALFLNDGDGTFTEATAAAGLQEPGGTRTIGAAFGDYDRDGWPDLFVGGYATVNRLYHNKGNGTFEEVARKAGVDGRDHINRGYVCFFVDYDNDTFPDILKTNLAPWDDVLLALSVPHKSILPSRRKRLLTHVPRLYRNNRDGTFADVTIQAGLVHPVGIMGANVADLDNDGFIDFYFGTGDPKIERMEPDRFYHNNGDGTFTDMTFATGLGNIGKGHGITFVDWDGDGDLEIYAPEGGFVHGDPWPNAFYLNGQKTGNHWLHVDLEGVTSNRDALDTQLILTAGDLTILRELKNGEGFGSSNSPTVEFGLGKAAGIDRLEVRWPAGSVQTFTGVPIDRRIVIREGERWKVWKGKS